MFLSTDLRKNTVQERIASIVENAVLKTNLVWLSRLLDNKHSLICLYNSFPQTLESAPIL